MKFADELGGRALTRLEKVVVPVDLIVDLEVNPIIIAILGVAGSLKRDVVVVDLVARSGIRRPASQRIAIILSAKLCRFKDDFHFKAERPRSPAPNQRARADLRVRFVAFFTVSTRQRVRRRVHRLVLRPVAIEL